MFNCTIYYFKGIGKKYFQNIEDTPQTLLSSYSKNKLDNAQIIICRQYPLVYHTYIRRLSPNRMSGYFGISLVFNGLEIDTINPLFELFEKFFEKIVSYNIVSIGNNRDFIIKKAPFTKSEIDILNEISEEIRADKTCSFVKIRKSGMGINEDICKISLSTDESNFKDKISNANHLSIVKHNNITSPELVRETILIQELNKKIKDLEEKLKNSPSSEHSNYPTLFNIILIVILLGVAFCFLLGFFSLNIKH